jgi:hypothetical protein
MVYIDLSQDRERLRALEDVVINLWVSQDAGISLTG